MRARAGRRGRAALLAAAVSALAIAACGGGRGGPDSLLLVTIDTVRADHLSCYDPESPARTPAIDRLAANGALVRRAWTTVPLTTPAHASILTGLPPQAHGVRNNARYALPESAETLAEILRASGRRTAAFVASYTTSREFGLAQGFDLYDDDLGHDEGGRPRPQRPGAEVVARARDWLARHADRPFFVWVHLFDAHSPYTPPADLAARHRGDPYSAEVELVDRLVGELAAALEANGAEKRTALAIVADHGEGLGTHGEREHGFLLYEETVRVPLILVAPGRIAPGTRVTEPASVIDLVPTLLPLLALPAPAGLPGRDLFAGDRPDGRLLYAEALQPFEEFGWSPLYAGLAGSLKVIDGPVPELYDLEHDPGEAHDLAPDEPERARSLAEELRAAAARWVDPGRLTEAAGLAPAPGADQAARLESLGYAGGGAPPGEAALPAPAGRAPREALLDHDRFLRAQELLKAGQFEPARAILERLHELEPKNPQFLLKLAVARERAGDAAAAESAYVKLARSRPAFLLARAFHAAFLIRNGRADEAVTLWRAVRRRFPEFVGATVNLARAQIAAGDAAAAAAELVEHLDHHPDDAEALSLLGKARAREGDLPAAIAAWDRALALRPTFGPALEPLVAALREAGRAEEARARLERARAAAPGDPLVGRLLRELH